MSEEKKSSYKGMTEARKRANAKYLANSVESVVIRFPKGKKDYYKSAAAAAGLSLNEFAISSMNQRIVNENLLTEEMKSLLLSHSEYDHQKRLNAYRGALGVPIVDLSAEESIYTNSRPPEE